MRRWRRGLALLSAVVVAALAYGATGMPEIDLSGRPSPSACIRSGEAVSGATSTGPRPAQEPGFLYRSGFDPSSWSGSLKRFGLLRDADGNVKLADSADWDAGEILTGTSRIPANPAPAMRRIYTSRTRADGTFMTVEFKWDELGREQQRQLNASPMNGKSDGLGSHRVDWLRGERGFEKGHPGGRLRSRERVLGDIMYSIPVYFREPGSNMRGDGLAAFRDRYRQRTGAVYVGANDGMLHAFDADNGTELFAYVPNMLMARLNRLTAPEYIHQAYVDGGLTVSEVRIGTRWRTALVGAMGGGAQGVFALDVTDPSDFAGGLGALWEFSDADDRDMGNVIGTPSIAKFKTSDAGGSAGYRYFAVVPSGVNNYRNDGAGKSAAAEPAVLFLLALDKPAAERWKEGINYYKFKMPSIDGIAGGMSSPVVIPGRDGAARIVYAADLQGNLWRFDFAGAAPWRHAVGTAPLFIARDAGGRRQPITVQPKVVFAPGGGYLVLFGTGKFLEHGDELAAGFTPQSFYAVLDPGRGDAFISGREDLAERTARIFQPTGAVDIGGVGFSYGTEKGTKRGWYIDFPDSGRTGERNVTDAQIAYGRVFFSTLIPGAGSCTTVSGRSYELDVLTGLPSHQTTSGAPSAGGALLPPLLFEAARPEISARGATGLKLATRTYTVLNLTDRGEVGEANPAREAVARVGTRVGVPAGRFSWREVVNWRELHRGAGGK